MFKSRCFDALLFVSLISFVSITMPITSIAIADYRATQSYTSCSCDGSTISNYTVDGKFFYHGRVNINATVNGIEYAGVLLYPPLKHWPLAFMPKLDIDNWYDSLNKTGPFQCFVDLNNERYPIVNEWVEIEGYYAMFTLCAIIVVGWSIIAYTVCNSKPHRQYISIPNELPPPYTPINKTINRTQSLYNSLNNELTTVSV